MKYRGARGGREQEIRVWDTINGVNSNNLKSLPSQIPTVQRPQNIKSMKDMNVRNPSYLKQLHVNSYNLTYPKICNPINKQSNEKISCLTLNCHSVQYKDILKGQVLRDDKIDFAVLTETWYSDEKQHKFETSDLNQNGYKLSVAKRKNKLGGGIALTC